MSNAAPARRPNLLVLIADQLTPRALPAYGNPVVQAPHIGRLAREGVVFDAAYCPSPLCAPSRQGLLTGRLPSAFGGFDNASELPSEIPTFAHHLRAAGYLTVLAGKMHFAGPNQLHGFEERLTTDIYPADFGWTPDWSRPDVRPEWFHNMGSVLQAGPCIRSNQLDFDEEVVFKARRRLFELARRPSANVGPHTPAGTFTDTPTGTGADPGAQLDASTDDRPFCLVVSLTHPHDPYTIPRRWWDRYEGLDVDPPRVGRHEVEDDPHSAAIRAACEIDRTPPSAQQVQNARRAYYGAISFVDDQVGELLQVLQDTGLAEGTIVLLLSDHGDMLGERGLWYKMHFFEGAARVPLIVHAPARFAPARVPGAVSTLDLLPTLAELAGAPLAPAQAAALTGRSLLPHLQGQGGHDEVFAEYLGEIAAAPIVMIRRGPWKYVHCPAWPDLLFNLDQDPDERVNLAETAAAAPPEIAAHLAALRAEALSRWDLPALQARVLASQADRHLVFAAESQGRTTPWDHQPVDDASRQYIRRHLDLDTLEAQARFPASFKTTEPPMTASTRRPASALRRQPLSLAVTHALRTLTALAGLQALGTAALAQTAAAAPAASPASAAASATETVTIFGNGQTRQVSELGRKELEALPPGTSPLKALANLPGVNFQSADPFGSYEWSTKLSVRGFNQNQLGFTLDDVPLGDMSYRNHNGLHISRAISAENLGHVLLSEGTGALETASSSNLGGTVQFRSAPLAEQAGGRLDQTVGSDALRRTFLRLDSGRLAGSTRASVSLSSQQADKWKGSGRQEQQQLNARFSSDLGEHQLSGFINTSSRKEVDYQDLSKEMINRLGSNWDNYFPDWQAALDSARGTWHQGETSIDDAYYAGSGLRRDLLAGLTLNAALARDVDLKTTVYHHADKGPSLWYTPYRPSSDATPVSLRTVEYQINRSGAQSTLSVSAGAHELRGSLWVEHNLFNQAMRFYGLDAGPRSPYDVPHDSFATRWDYRFDTQTIQASLSDTVRFSPALTATVGAKALSSHHAVLARVGEAKPGGIAAQSPFLPQVGLNWRLGREDELFSSLARNLRDFKAAAMEDSPFATSAAGFLAIRDSLKPETSTTAELGWRHRDERLETTVTAYHTVFQNRLLAIQKGSAIEGNPAVLANVGRVKTDGVEAGAAWRPLASLRWTSSLALNRSRYESDVIDNGVRVPVAGKQVVDAPRVIASSHLDWEQAGWQARLGANHVGRRFYTYTNDNGVAAYTLWDLSGGFKGGAVGLLKSWQVTAGLNNLFDRRTIASIGTNGFVTSDPQGTAQTLLPGAPRSAFASLSGQF